MMSILPSCGVTLVSALSLSSGHFPNIVTGGRQVTIAVGVALALCGAASLLAVVRGWRVRFATLALVAVFAFVCLLGFLFLDFAHVAWVALVGSCGLAVLLERQYARRYWGIAFGAIVTFAGIIYGLALLVIDFTFPIVIADGYVDVNLSVTVCDALTDAPVAQALVRVRDISGTSTSDDLADLPVEIPEGEPGVGCTTSEDGEGRLTCRLRVTDVWRRFSRWEGDPSFAGRLCLQVSAPGYRPEVRFLEEIAREQRWRGNSRFREVVVRIETRR